MSIFHETMREILEDVQKFLNITLQHEHLSAASISHKESLLIKIHHLRTEYPQLHLKIIPEVDKRGPGSPPPYADMQGNIPTTEYVCSDSVEEEYEICDAPDNSSHKGHRDTLSFGSALISGTGKDSTELMASELNDVIKAGFLDKKGKDRLGGWLSLSQRRWVALKSDCLLFFNKNTDKRPCSQLPLLGYDSRQILYPTKEGSKKDAACFELVGPGKKTYQFVAVSQNDAKEWTDAIQKVTSNLTENSSTSLLSTTTAPTYSDSSQGGSGDGVCSNRTSVRESSVIEDKALLDDVYESVEDGIITRGSTTSDWNDADDELYQDTDGSLLESKEPPQDKSVQYSSDLYVGLWDCRADAGDELNFKRGDLIKVISKEYDSYHWWVGELNGTVGLVPKLYLMEAYEMDCER